MKKRVGSSVLLMLSLVVLLLVAGLSAAGAAVAADDDSKNAIRVPTDGTGLADLLLLAVKRATEGDNERPWRCCDLALCLKTFPQTCRCLDKVERCTDACKECTETEGSRRTCMDWYLGDPGPRCQDDINGGVTDLDVPTLTRHAAAGAPGGGMMKDDDNDDKSRPWKCCDLQACTRSQPPTCRCRDEVKRCARTCKRCEKVEEEGSSDNRHSRYRCLDTYHGDPAPPCSSSRRRGGAMMMRRAVVDAILRGYVY